MPTETNRTKTAAEAKRARIESALSDLKILYRKHGFEVIRAAMSRYNAALLEKNKAERIIREQTEKLRKAEKGLR